MDKLRKLILEVSYEAGACHIGSALSCIDILAEIFNKKRESDLFVFSKASGVCAYYLLLAEKGIISKNKLVYYLKHYPLVNKNIPSVIWSGGSLGHGLPVATGLALADRSRNVYVLISDGEIQEGTTYESALFARQHKLSNLFVYCDNNGLQACGKTKDIIDLRTAIKFLYETLPNFKNVKTIKAKGWKGMEGKFESHYLNINKQQLNNLLR